jgi:hypothetical protein
MRELQNAFPTEDAIATESQTKIAGLLAVAYQRKSTIRRGLADRAGAEPHDKLALPGEPSVHGVVP